ncbi:hypothetical protein KKF59_02340 [Patescibacteria group bacterium]|nr:hypothetical protein [Patescibacteria group bacterium]
MNFLITTMPQKLKAVTGKRGRLLADGKIGVLKLIAKSLLFSMVSGLLLAVQPVAAGTEGYQAEVSTGAVMLETGQVKLITLKFKNIGSQTWTRGQNATAVYLYGDSTIFKHPSWIKNDLPALIDQATVKLGQMASASFYVVAPSNPGVYTERFLLSSGPNAWIKGSVVTVTFTVLKAAAKTASVSSGSGSAVVAVTDKVPASSEYKAVLIDKGGIEWQLKPEEHVVVDIKFKNAGTKTWQRDGGAYLSLYTWGPKYRTSLFKDFSWKTGSQSGVLVEKEVKPGQIGTLRLELRAPTSTGSFQEQFQLAVEDKAWVDGGSVTLPIRVVGNGTVVAEGDKVENQNTESDGTYASILLLTSSKNLKIAGSSRLQLTHGFKNEGTAVWGNRELRLLEVQPSLGAYSNVHDESWASSDVPVKESNVISPGEIGFVSYTMKAPAKKGDYTVSFQLVADGREVEGGEISIPVTVTSDGYVDPTPIPIPGPAVSSIPPPLNGDEASLPPEPIIRVGLYKTTDDTMILRGIQTGMNVTQASQTICTFAQNEEATVVFDRNTKIYRLSGPRCTSQSDSHFVFIAADGISPLEITDYSRPVSWLPGANDNKFRAKLELRYTPATDAVWVINELLVESYLYGIAETSNVSPLEYQKALLTAARTYAMYHVNRGTKHADEFFTVDAHFDQVYRGYGQEERSPDIVDGVVKTRGQIVTYDGNLAITPYFSRSDGRTRDWTEVWGGKGYAWLKSVPVPHDVGQTLWGHGVGLSARGALYMASKDNATYDAILKHFYQGTELRRAYK